MDMPKSLTQKKLTNDNQNDMKAPDHIHKMNLEDLEGQNTILPKGYMKALPNRYFDASDKGNNQSVYKNRESEIKLKHSVDSENSSDAESLNNKKGALDEIDAKHHNDEDEAQRESDSEANNSKEEIKE